MIFEGQGEICTGLDIPHSRQQIEQGWGKEREILSLIKMREFDRKDPGLSLRNERKLTINWADVSLSWRSRQFIRLLKGMHSADD